MCIFLHSANQWTGFYMIKDLRHERAKGLFLIQFYFFCIGVIYVQLCKNNHTEKKRLVKSI